MSTSGAPMWSSDSVQNSYDETSRDQNATEGAADGAASTFNNIKDSVMSSANSAAETVQNHPITQNTMQTVRDAPVTQKAQEEVNKTSNEFSDLASSRKVPDQKTATGQPLTQYHSMFYRLLSWKNPRATAVVFLSHILFIFAARYLNIIRYIFKGLYVVLGITAAAEVAGKLVFNNGFTSQMRPKKYFVIPKESLERFLDDAEQLINFFVIEIQRVIFAENVYVTTGAFFLALISYWLIKFMPLWGLALLGTSTLYLAPLVYTQNKEFIDAQLQQGADIMAKQTQQVRDVSSQYANKAGESARMYAQQAQDRAQELMGQAKHQGNKASEQLKQNTGMDQGQASGSGVSSGDFPSAPREEPIASANDPEPVPAT